VSSREQEQNRPEERIVIRDKRKIDPTGGLRRTAEAAGAAKPAPAQPEQTAVTEEAAQTAPPEPAVTTTEAALADGAAEAPSVDEPAAPVEEGVPEEVAPGPSAAELEALRAELDERTKDLQRVTAEYANYRKRVDRDRGLITEQAIASVLTALLPVLDDLDRAREHGDLVGPFGSVAEQLIGALTKFGLTAFGEKGDPFDPNRHEAVAHSTSPEVTEPTCIEVMRRGYLLNDRLLRPAMVAVADPE
jgi:molecular chaperone GrpE